VSLDGFVVIDKAAGCTSHDVVGRARRQLGTRRVGHAGTLDPDATGVLVLGIGVATRLLRFAVETSKVYLAEIALGSTTTTLDASGEVTGRYEMSGVTLEDARRAASSLTGRISQVPPMVSARKVGGRRLYQLAREGIEVEREPRLVEVTRFELSESGRPGILRAEVECSAGTYVRSLAADLGTALGGGAHLTSLRRVAVGPWEVAGAIAIEELTPERVRPPAELLAHLAQVQVGAELAALVAVGRVLARSAVAVDGDGPFAVCDTTGSLLAVYESLGPDQVKPAVVLARH